jgi:hypothetical protein
MSLGRDLPSLGKSEKNFTTNGQQRSRFLNAVCRSYEQSFSLRFRKLRNLLCKIQTVASVSGLGRHLEKL